MEGISAAASIIGVIQLTGSIVKICGGYLQEVKNARQDIITLQRSVTGLEKTVQKLRDSLEDPDGLKLAFSQSLFDSITNCLSDLGYLKKTIDPGEGKGFMRRFGIRSLKWPIKYTELDKFIQNLERHKSTFALALQIDQSIILASLARNSDRIDQNIGLDKLPIAHGAEFDNYIHQHEDKCLPGTRTDLLHQISEWTISLDKQAIFWLHGEAGTGKSTIARTAAKSFKQANLLGATFFFKRGEPDRGNASKVFSTVADQLVRRFPQLRSSVREAIANDPMITSKSLREQFDRLLLQPLLDTELLNPQPLTIVMVFDALDECESDSDIRVIIQSLSRLQEASAFRLRVLLTSRPELSIRLEISKLTNQHYLGVALHDIPESVTEHDISLFLTHRLSQIREIQSLPSNWPGDAKIQALVKISVPLFIFAATVCRIFEDSHWDPVESLDTLLTRRADGAQMNGTYLPILDRLLVNQSAQQKEQLVQEFRVILGTIVILELPLPIRSLSTLTGLSESKVKRRLNPLHSVIRIPEDKAMPINLYHLSFRDFLLHPETRGKTLLWVDKTEINQKLATQCLSLTAKLKRNICGLSSDGILRADIDAQKINCSLSSELQYSCRFWAHHALQTKDPISMVNNAFSFLQKHLLHWVEAMILLDCGSDVLPIIDRLLSITQDGNDDETSKFLGDARRFVLKNREISDIAPLQLYCSGLVFTPKAAMIRTQFEKELPVWITQLPEVEEKWSANLQTLEGHSGLVMSVIFSPDGRWLASGSNDKTVRLWDAATGTLLLTLRGHVDQVSSVAFSPKGLLASGSRDSTIRLWDAAMGTLLLTLQGHMDQVSSVAFSPDGRLLASGSRDSTIRLWDALTGVPQQILRAYKDRVRSVTFSPDGLYLASSSKTNVRLWDVATGALQQTLEGHSGTVESVAFHPGGRLLASGSRDQNIIFWDATTGVLQQTLRGHSSRVTSLAFSPNGQWLASSSWDNTLRLWNTAAGVLQRTLEGHSGIVESVAFHPGGRSLASGSRDHTIRFWDTAIDSRQQTFEGHSSQITTVAFSPDGRWLASGSWDSTVRLWDTATGGPKLILKGHLHPIEAIAFSPDGQQLASGSWDGTVRLWDTVTGALQQILKGHSNWVTTVAFSPDSRRLASGSWDMTVQLWDTVTGVLQHTLEGHLNSVDSVAFSPDGRLLASGSRDSTIRLWDVATGLLKQILEGHSNWVTTVMFSPGGQWLVSGPGPRCTNARGTTMWCYDPARGALCSGSWDNTVRLWDAATGLLQQTFCVEKRVTALEFSGDGSYLITNLGRLNIRLAYDDHTQDGTPESIKIYVQDNEWIILHGEKALWLPPEYRPVCSAVAESTLALGHASGQVSLLSFR